MSLSHSSGHETLLSANCCTFQVIALLLSEIYIHPRLRIYLCDGQIQLTDSQILSYMTDAPPPALCAAERNPDSWIRTIFRALFGFWMKFLACLTVSVTVLIISAGRRSTETHRCSFICLLGQCILKSKKGHWVWEESWLWLQLATRLKPLFNKAWV